MAEKDKLENIVGSGVPVNIKGKEYKLGIFNMRDLADFRQYIKGQRIKVIQETTIDDTAKIGLINNVLESNINEMKELSNMDGVCFMLWKALQKYQPEMTLDDADKLIDMDNVAEISSIVMNIGGRVKNPLKGAKKK
ncbi:hypothetical protein ES705_18304 [subsurface metagenome]